MQKVRALSFWNIFYMLIIYLFFFLLKSPAEASDSFVNAIELCYRRVIPSLFPFMVLSELTLSSGLAVHLGNYIGKPVSKLFKISKESTIAFIGGGLFGFPLGTKITASLYENGTISKEEAERLICFCSNTGPAFVVGVVGAAIENQKIAYCIYFCQIVSAIIIGLCLRKNGNTTKEKYKYDKPKAATGILPKAIVSSVLPMLNVCAFVCFFSCVTCSVDNILSFCKLGDTASVFISGVLELTNGIKMLSYIPMSHLTVFLAGGFVGWSGLSVILQSISITSKNGLNCKKYIIAKLIQGALCALLCVIVCKLFKLY